MTGSPPGSDTPRGFERRVALTRAGLTWRRLWTGIFPAVTLLGGFAALALFGLTDRLEMIGHSLLLTGVVAGAAVFMGLGLRGFRIASRKEALAEMERAAGLKHAPLSGAEDSLGAGRGDPVAEGLWKRHIAQLKQRLIAARAAWPTPLTALKDPYAVRGLVLLGLITGFATAGADAPARLAEAFTPRFSLPASAQAPSFDAWITPPAYTGATPVRLAESGGRGVIIQRDALSVPAGSVVTLRVGGPEARVMLNDLGDGFSNDPPPAFTRLGPDALAAEVTLKASAVLTVTASGQELGRWEVTVLPDAPPAIAFDGELTQTARQSVRVPFTGGDDYGVTGLALHLRLAEPPEGADAGAEIVSPLPSGAGGKKIIRGAGVVDLTAHAWAGLPVTARLVAEDAAGQKTESAAVTFILPERVFTKPLAQALAEQRKRLSGGLSMIASVAGVLEALTVAPERFAPKAGIHIAMRAALFRLLEANEAAELKPVQELLWDIALAVEEGDAGQAADDLRAAQKELEDALRRGASDAEIAALTERLREALRRTMEAMAREGQNAPMAESGETLSAEDMEKLIDRIEELSRTGAREAAEELLSQLQEMTQGLGAPMAEPSEREKQLTEQLNALNEIVREQERLRDETYRAGQREDAPGLDDRAQADPKDLEQRQGELAGKLDETAKSSGGGESEDTLNGARAAMQAAEGELAQRDLRGAVPRQDEALERLRAAARQTQQALAEEQQRSGGIRMGRTPGGRAPGTDPAGRPDSQGRMDTGGVKVPTERESQRAREILDELRRRAGEQGRPEAERDYLERLLRRF